MAFCSGQFHQTVFAVFSIQDEGQPHQYRCGDHSETNAEPLADTYHVHDHKEHKGGKQTTHEDEQVLRFEPFEFNRASNSFVD